jgi:hypothetical protein
MSDNEVYSGPKARKQNFLVESLDDEILLYDVQTNEATCLNASAVLIWELCDGQRTIGKIRDEVGNPELTERHVADILDQLREQNLLENDATVSEDVTVSESEAEAASSRRSFLGHAAAASLVLPVVMSMRVPAAAQSLSKLGAQCGPPLGDSGTPSCNNGVTGPAALLTCCPDGSLSSGNPPITTPTGACCVSDDTGCGNVPAPIIELCKTTT